MSSSATLPRGSRLLTPASSVKLVRSVKDFVGNARCATAAFARIVGCSRRTARRLLHPKTEEDFPRLRRCYAVSAAKATGIPLNILCGRADRSPAADSRLNLWSPVDCELEARRKAMAAAAQLSARASFGYDLVCDLAVSHGLNGRPSSVVLEVTAADGAKHHIILKDFDGTGKIGMSYSVSGEGQVLRHHSADNALINKIFKTIKRSNGNSAKNNKTHRSG